MSKQFRVVGMSQGRKCSIDIVAHSVSEAKKRFTSKVKALRLGFRNPIAMEYKNVYPFSFTEGFICIS